MADTISEKSIGYSSRKPSFATVDRRRLADVLAQPYGALSSSAGGGTSSRILPRQIASGAYRGQQFAGNPDFQYNQSEGNLLIRDSTTNRFLAGKQKSGF